MKVLHTVVSDNLTEEQALKIEAELISAFGIRSQGGLLTNRVRLNPNTINKCVRINVPAGCYEKAQMGLELLKSSIKELAKANPEGIKNPDAENILDCSEIMGAVRKTTLVIVF